MIINIPHDYVISSNNDTCVVGCFFNPCNYKTTVKNANIVLNYLQKANIPTYITELLYPNQKSQLIYTSQILQTDSVFFAKENLWNITEKIIPSKYKKIIFIDLDILFTNPDWFNQSSILLDKYSIIQPMSFCYRNIKNNEIYNSINLDTNNIGIVDTTNNDSMLKTSIAYSIVNKLETKDLTKSHPGYSLGIKREILNKIGGFFEYGIVGSGDTLFWSCLLTEISVDHIIGTNLDVQNKYKYYKKNISNIIALNDIGYLKETVCCHLYHGSLKNRQYGTRNTTYDNDTSFSVDSNGLIKLSNDSGIRKYFYDRFEDH